ncbi:MAG: tRNA (guanosine(37)-N1)-methyltransferase TrmD [Fibrobacter sp.]|nr:tRNA (guanosine(37)-N1)-methyltransferase TrmD [Fibrobacter sp.]
MKIDAITLFPEMFSPMEVSIMGRAQKAGILDFNTVQLRDFAINEYGQVDDAPYGGEAGMVLRPEPLAQAIKHCQKTKTQSTVIHLCPDGKTFDQQMAQELAHKEHLILVCGHYKGIDQRIRDKYVDMEVSLGDFVISGGELAAMMLSDAVVRLIPGVLNRFESAETDSFSQNMLAWPIYTRPEEFEGLKVPKVLLSGHHKNIKQWQKAQALKITQEKRPDLLKKTELSDEDLRLL